MTVDRTPEQPVTAKVRHTTEAIAIAGWLMSKLTEKLFAAERQLRIFNNRRGPDRD